MSHEDKIRIHALLDEVFTKGNLNYVHEVCTDDVELFTHVRPAPFVGPAGVMEFAGMIRGAFPDSRVEMHDLLSEGDLVAARYTLHGTHLGSLAGLPATGSTVAVAIQEMFRLQDGRVRELRLKLDPMQVMQQIGVLPVSDGVPPALIMMAHVRRRIGHVRSLLRRVGDVLQPGAAARR